MVRRMASLGFIMGVLLALNGCVMGYAELVRRDQAGGILALKGDRQAAMQDAQAQMQAHCGGPYTVVSEENAVVGEQTAASAGGSQRQYGNAQYQSGSSYSQTTAVTEYRITYACGAAAAPAPVAVAPAPAVGAQVTVEATAPPPPPPPTVQGNITVQGGVGVGP